MKSHRSAGRHNFLNPKLLLKHLSNHSYTAVLHDIYMYLLCHFLSHRFLRFPRTKRVFIILHLGVSKIQAGFSIWFMKKGGTFFYSKNISLTTQQKPLEFAHIILQELVLCTCNFIVLSHFYTSGILLFRGIYIFLIDHSTESKPICNFLLQKLKLCVCYMTFYHVV